ncbi:MAG: ribonuclease Z [Bacteroidetes bacterium RBG_13_43_22]|nr:MAG: ribonuclease Z [Bacteroidetes bacterium RBG_13_43_22]
MKLSILGSSSALPTSERFPTAHVLNVHERLYLIDCGEGTQMQLRKNRLRFGKINHIFISHLHGDHVFGLYGLLSTFSLMGRTNPVKLYAPLNYQGILLSHLNDFDIHLNFEIDFHALSGSDPVMILDDKHLTVTSFPLEHRVPAFGFLFREKPYDRNIIKECIDKYRIPTVRIPAIKKGEDYITAEGDLIRNKDLTVPGPVPLSYAYCSDTKYFTRLAAFVKSVDLLYHEATFDKSLDELAGITGHSTTLDAARTASEAEAKALIIGHFSARYKDINTLVEEARSLFPNTFPAIDGKTYEIGKI